MATRPTWQGYLRLSLVSCPVALYTATNSGGDVRFNMLHKKTHNRIRMIPTNAKGDAVDRADIVKGIMLGNASVTADSPRDGSAAEHHRYLREWDAAGAEKPDLIVVASVRAALQPLAPGLTEVEPVVLLWGRKEPELAVLGTVPKAYSKALESPSPSGSAAASPSATLIACWARPPPG